MNQKPRGTQDIFLKNAEIFDFIVKTAQETAMFHNFSSIKTPTFEHTELFERNIGEETDAISKELYRFCDQSSRNLALRPEFTAGIVRAFCENKELYTHTVPLRLFSYGSLFRYDRPKKGRYREFHQINFELFNESCDISAIGVAIEILQNLKILNKTTLLINLLGDAKKPYTQAVYKYFSSHYENLSQTSKARLEKNPLRILDSKEPQDIKLFDKIPKIRDFYSENDKKNLNETIEFLKNSNIDFKVDEHLVRGLDYYTGIIFEFISPIAEDGQNLTILGGGRYDNLIEQIGKKPVNAIGFAGGIERLAMLCEYQSQTKKIFIVNTLNKSLFKIIHKIQKKIEEELCEKNLQFQEIFAEKNKIGKTLERLSSEENAFAIIIGENEIENKMVLVKNLTTKQIECEIKDIDLKSI